MRTDHRFLTAALIAATLTGVSGCKLPDASSTAPTGADGVDIRVHPKVTADARTVLASLPVRAEDTGHHYDRAVWGGWITDRRHGCDTRELVLRNPDTVTGTGCTPLCPPKNAPCWYSAYDSIQLSDPGKVQVDHLVPVKEAHRSGTRAWTREQRAAFYNDLSNLYAVSAASNTSKGDRDPGVWKPPNRAHWCQYAVVYIGIKGKYSLTVDTREHAGLTQMLTTCPTG